uniref:Uncharacterized protein n=1 Tax=Plectus sambesii TaxID=2011161 RepID=A0A914UHJ7_9BILA
MAVFAHQLPDNAHSPRSSKQCTPRSRKPPDALSRSRASLTKRAIFLLDAAVYSRSPERRPPPDYSTPSPAKPRAGLSPTTLLD